MGIFKAKDPVCGMKVDKKAAKHKTDYKGKTYYFCAAGCKEAFEEEPEKYLKEKHTHSMGGCH